MLVFIVHSSHWQIFVTKFENQKVQYLNHSLGGDELIYNQFRDIFWLWVCVHILFVWMFFTMDVSRSILSIIYNLLSMSAVPDQNLIRPLSSHCCWKIFALVALWLLSWFTAYSENICCVCKGNGIHDLWLVFIVPHFTHSFDALSSCPE